MWLPLLAIAVLQQQTTTTQSSSPIATVTVRPSEAAIQVGDTIRLAASARDSAGRSLTDVAIRWFQSGGHFEGKVDSTGLVTGGATGTITVTALVSPAAGGSPTPGFARVTILSPPASRIAFDPEVTRMYAGQSLVVNATPFASNGDRRHDDIVWKSSAPAVVSVSAEGRLTAGRAGRATVTARAGRATQPFTVTVVANPVAAVALEPATSSVRTGDVVPLTFSARSSSGKTIAAAVPEWSFNPGSGQIDGNGRFVADVPGSYRVTAVFAGKTAQATVMHIAARAMVLFVMSGVPSSIRSSQFFGGASTPEKRSNQWLYYSVGAGGRTDAFNASIS